MNIEEKKKKRRINDSAGNDKNRELVEIHYFHDSDFSLGGDDDDGDAVA